MHISKLPGIQGGHASAAELEEELNEIEREHDEQLSQSNLFQKLQTDLENEKAVLMGNKEGVMFIYMINCVICILFLIQGILMWQASKPSQKVADYLISTDFDASSMPEDLLQHTRVESYLQQRAKFKYCFFVSIFTTILIFLSTFLRININSDTYAKEERILLTMQSMKDHY